MSDFNSKLNRQKTSSNNIGNGKNADYQASGSHNPHANSLTTARSPSIKKTMERNFTRHTVANTLDNNSRGASLSKEGGLTLTSSVAHVQSRT